MMCVTRKASSARDTLHMDGPMTPEELKRIRTTVLRVSIEEMAERIGINPRTIRRMQSGKAAISETVADRIRALRYVDGRTKAGRDD